MATRTTRTMLFLRHEFRGGFIEPFYEALDALGEGEIVRIRGTAYIIHEGNGSPSYLLEANDKPEDMQLLWRRACYLYELHQYMAERKGKVPQWLQLYTSGFLH